MRGYSRAQALKTSTDIINALYFTPFQGEAQIKAFKTTKSMARGDILPAVIDRFATLLAIPAYIVRIFHIVKVNYYRYLIFN